MTGLKRPMCLLPISRLGMGVKLPIATIREWFFVENKHYPLIKRRERVVARIKRWMDMQLDKVWEQSLKERAEKEIARTLRTYLTGWPEYTAFRLYQMLFSDKGRPDSFPAHLLQDIPESIVTASAKLFKKKEVQLEDLAPLLYIHTRLHGIPSDRLFDHVVIDEAQDFSPFQVACLDAYTRNSSFTILGDLSQGIHAYQGIQDWKEFSSLFQPEAKRLFRAGTKLSFHDGNHSVCQSGAPARRQQSAARCAGFPQRQ